MPGKYRLPHPLPVPRLLVAALFLLPAGAAAQAVQVVASIPPYAMLARAVAGPEAEVNSLVRPGQDPHRFDPTVRQVAALNGADLVVHNGLGEQWLEGHLDGVAAERRLTVSESLPFRAIRDGRGAVNGHLWLDPHLAQRLVAVLATRLTALHPEAGPDYARRAAETVAAIQAAEREAAERLEGIDPKKAVTFHPSFDYFFRHYDWQVVGTFRDLAGNEAGGSRLTRLLQTIEAQGLPAVFRERTTPANPVEALAADAGVAVGVLDPLGLDPAIEDYPDLLLHNARAIAEAYGG